MAGRLAQVARWITDRRLLLAASLTLLALLAAASVPVPRAGIELAVQAGSLALALGAPVDQSPGTRFGGKAVVAVDGLDGADLGSLGCARLPKEEGLQLVGNFELNHLRLGKGATLELYRAGSDRLEMWLRGDSSIDISAARGVVVTTGSGTSLACIDAGNGGVITLTASSTARPLRLTFPPPDPGTTLHLADLQVEKLGFAREQGGAEWTPRFVSTIVRGTLRLLDTDKEITLRPGEPLRLRGFTGEAVDINVGQGDIAILVVGRIGWAGSVELGPEGFRRNVTPSVLGYIVSSQTLHALWVGVAGMFGALWGVRRWARGRRK